jgi:hypothetical protein
MKSFLEFLNENSPNKIIKNTATKEKPKSNKIPKEAVLYIFRPEVNITCQKCVFIKGGNKAKNVDGDKCAVLGPTETISAKSGSCGFYIHGDLGEAGEVPWIGFITKPEAGYFENKTGFQCKRCEYFDAKTMDCEKVDKDSEGDTPGIIHPDACCNRWEPDSVRAKLPANKLFNILN